MRFKALVLSVVAAVGMTSAAQAGQNVLYYEEFTLGVSAYQAALDELGWSFTFTNNPAVFAAELAGPDVYTHVISAHQNTFAAGGYETALATWATSNPDRPVLISDWRVNNPQPYLAALGFAYGGSTNITGVHGVAGGELAGLGGSLSSPGWGIFSYDVSGPVIEATSSAGGAGLPAVARNGEWWFNGFLSDTFSDPTVGKDIVIQELIPAPGALALLGLAGLVGRRRRR